MSNIYRASARCLFITLLLCLFKTSLVCAHGPFGHVHDHHDHEHDKLLEGSAHQNHPNAHGHAHSHAHDHLPHAHASVDSSATCTSSSVSCRALRVQTSATHLTVEALSNTPLWAAALISSALTGVASLFAIVLLPLQGTLLKPMLPFAAGALLADCTLHLLPALYTTSDTHAGHAHSPLNGSVGALLCGIAAFFILDAATRRMSGDSCGHAHKSTSGDFRGDRAARMNLAADGLHNFCDGLSIGAAYLVSRRAGVATTLAVLLHELPQEVGDFAILLRSGWSRRWALFANVACAGTAVIGTAVALVADRVASNAAREAILPFAAGGLLYLALTAILPDVLDDIAQDVAVKGSKKGEMMQVGLILFVGRVFIAVVAGAVGVATVAAIEGMHEH